MSSSSTSRLQLIKPNPGTGEPVNLTTHINQTWDKIDDAVGAKPVTSGTRPTSPWHGQIIRETDTGRVYEYNATAGAWDELVSDRTPWVAITPTWTALTTNPVLGAGTISGRYMRVGRMITYVGRLLMAADTTYGSGEWRISLPAGLSAAQSSLGAGSALLYDNSSTSARTPGVCWLANSTTLAFNGSNGALTATAPFAWATSDQLRWAITYEI